MRDGKHHYLHHTADGEDQDVMHFHPDKWGAQARDSMFKATAALDKLCETIIYVKKFYPLGPVARGLRELALTASVFDPALFSYASQVQQFTRAARELEVERKRERSLKQAKKTKSLDRKTAPEKLVQADMSLGGRAAVRAQAVTRAEEKPSSHHQSRMEKNPGSQQSHSDGPQVEGRSSWRHPPPSSGREHSHTALFQSLGPTWALWQLQSGGFVSLLELLSSTLLRLAQTVRRLLEVSSFRAYIIRRRISLSAVAFVWIGYSNSWLFDRLLQLIARHVLGIHIADWFGIPPSVKYMVIPACWFCLYKRTQQSLLALMERQHRQLNTLLRLWQICMSNLERDLSTSNQPIGAAAQYSGPGGARMRGGNTWLANSSGRGGHGGGAMSKHSGESMGTARSLVTWMMEKVPPALDSSFWYYQSNDRLHLLKVSLDNAYATINVWHNSFANAWSALPLIGIVTSYYFLRPQEAAYKASQLLSAPDIVLVRNIWKVLDSRVMSWILWALLRRPRRLHIQRVRLREEQAHQKDAKEMLGVGTGLLGSTGDLNLGDNLRHTYVGKLSANSFHSDSDAEQRLQWSQHMLSGQSIASLDETDQPSGRSRYRSIRHNHPDPIRFWVSSVNALDFIQRGLGSSVPVVIYLHGGGFVGSFPETERQMVARWADDTRALVVYVDYSKAPKAKYPVPLDECYSVYRYVIQGKLGFHPKSLVLVGESSGGSLAAGLCIRAIEDGFRVPDGIVLGYPVLSMEDKLTPSRSLFMMDPVVPMNLIRQCRSAYLPKDIDISRDQCISPLLASNHILSKFPPTDIMVGTYDPFQDDSILFAQRLTANGVRVRLRRFKDIPHAFWCFQPALLEAKEGLSQASEWIKSYFEWESIEPHRNLLAE